MDVDLDLELKSAEPDRWLSTRFIADADARADVAALYAFDHALQRIAHVVSQPMLGEIRLAWWREAVEDAFARKPPRAHPVVEALSTAIGRRDLDVRPFETLIEARERNLNPDRFDLDDAVRYAEAGAGSVMSIAARMLDPVFTADFSAPGRAWGLARLAVERRMTPAAQAEAASVVMRALKQTVKLPGDVFPAVVYATFARDYAAGRTPSHARKQLRLLWSIAVGRL